MSTTESLWGEIPLQVSFDLPVSILKQQAAALGKATQGLLSAKVRAFKPDDKGSIGHELVIVAPALSNYSVTIASIMHNVSLYPAVVYNDVSEQVWGEVHDQDQLKDGLRVIFQSNEVQRILKGLISQSLSEGSKDEGE